jgi:transposase InsO family protein
VAELGLAGRRPKKPRSLTRQGKRPASPDLVRRKFDAVAPDVLWCGDVTQIDTDEGKLYLATVEDLFSRRLLAYAMSEHHDAALTVASLQMAVVTRGGDVDGAIFHSDRGSEYTAARYQAECRKHGVVQSMGRVACALDNAASEAFNSTLKVEFVHRHRAGMLEAAVPVIDSDARGIPHPADDVVAEIDHRLQEIADREPCDRIVYLESLAARIGLRHKGVQPQEPVLELAAQLGVTAEDYREAKKISERFRETGVR